MQPQKEVKSKKSSLLQRLRTKHIVELGMELKGFASKFTLDGTKDKKILVALNGEEFLGSAKNINEALGIIADFENKDKSDYNISEIKTTYVYQEEEIETKIREEVMPRRFPKTSGLEWHGRQFYIVKKQPNGKSSGKVFCAYNWKTRNLIGVHWDKDILIGMIMNRYHLIQDKDVM